jgi:prephenate dehydratase
MCTDIQALGQSATFLNAHLPNAKRISTASTALAAESLLEQGKGGRAAICSKSVIGIYPELEVLVEGTQDRSGMSPFFFSFSPFLSLIILSLYIRLPCLETHHKTLVWS